MYFDVMLAFSNEKINLDFDILISLFSSYEAVQNDNMNFTKQEVTNIHKYVLNINILCKKKKKLAKAS